MQELRAACEAIGVDENELARRLGVTAGCLRAWKRNGIPAYGRWALSALVAGLDPSEVLRVA